MTLRWISWVGPTLLVEPFKSRYGGQRQRRQRDLKHKALKEALKMEGVTWQRIWVASRS